MSSHVVAAFIFSVLLLSGCGDASSPPVADASPTALAPGSPAPSPTVESAADPPSEETTQHAVYFVGPGPDGPDAPEAALYRYVEPRRPDQRTILDPLTFPPSDPDYRTLWPRGSFDGVGDPEAGISVVRLDGSVPVSRPEGMSEREAELAVQQVAWTVREYYYREKPDVYFMQRNRPVDSVFGVPTDGGLVRAAPELSVLSRVNITSPGEGAVVGDQLVVRGLAHGYEGTAACFVEHPSGSALWSGATIAGWQEDRLFPFEVEVDLRSLPSGTYVLRCSNDDPTGGTEGRGADTDTRTFVIDQPGNPEPLQPIFYVGLTPDGGTGLFRCLEPNETGEPNHGTGWYLGQLTDDPTDLAYWTWWRRNTFTGMLSEEDGITTVEIRDPSYVRPRRSMTVADARLALQQLAWTLGADAIRLSVDEAFGVDVSEPIARDGAPPPSC